MSETATEKSKVDFGSIKEDDELEYYDAEDWTEQDEENQEVNWELDWENKDPENPFAKHLRAPLRNEAEQKK